MKGQRFVEVRKKEVQNWAQENPLESLFSSQASNYSTPLMEEITLEVKEETREKLRIQSESMLENKIKAYTQGRMEETPFWYGDSYKTLTRKQGKIKVQTLEELTDLQSLIRELQNRNPTQELNKTQKQIREKVEQL